MRSKAKQQNMQIADCDTVQKVVVVQPIDTLSEALIVNFKKRPKWFGKRLILLNTLILQNVQTVINFSLSNTY